MLYIRKLFTQDLRDGKQIAFPKEPSYSFFSFDYQNREADRRITFTFNARFEQFQKYDGKVIATRLYSASSESRMDGEVKAFIRDELNAKVDDLLIFKNKGTKYTEYEVMFVPQNNKYYSLLLKLCGGENHSVYSTDLKINFDRNEPLQSIYYGAPGTGKSHEIKEKTKGEAVIRTTFHPDSDYSTFVGAYKPTMDDVDAKVVPVVLGESGTVFNKNEGTYKEKRIVYQFVMQAFLKAYLGAWKKYAEADGNEVDPQFLIIEEINRGNCAQIFGDLFQLLDRKEGVSEYPIMADRDLAKYLLNGKYENNVDVLTNKEGIKDGKLRLPKNLYIWATMNTSDQSLFPIDSAFKRRWDWVYIPIKNHEEENYKINIDGTIYSWWGFLEKINKIIGQVTSSEDKKLGYFFVKAIDKIVDANKFVGKVLFYLWNDVFKNYGFENAIFNRGENIIFNFSDFFDKNGDPETAVVNEFLKKLDETVDKEHSFVSIENEGSPSSLIIMHNGESIEGDSAVSKYIEFINRAIKEKDVNEVADCLGADMTQTPPEDTTRKFLQVGDSEWYLATNIGIGVMKSNINKIKKLGVDVVIE